MGIFEKAARQAAAFLDGGQPGRTAGLLGERVKALPARLEMVPHDLLDRVDDGVGATLLPLAESLRPDERREDQGSMEESTDLRLR